VWHGHEIFSEGNIWDGQWTRNIRLSFPTHRWVMGIRWTIFNQFNADLCKMQIRY